MSAAFPFKPDVKLLDVMKRREFTVSAEIIPPRNGAEQRAVFEQIHELIRSGAEFLSVTKGAGGSLRGGSLPIAQAIKEQFGVPCIAHFTCRDLTAFEVENSLIDHHYFGIRNILALRGDPPDGQSEWKPREGGHTYAYQLIEQIRALNEGKYLARVGGGGPAGGTERTEFCIGCAVYPEHPDPVERLDFFRLKVEAGAEYGITDMIFDADAYGRFLDLCARGGVDVPVLPGTRVLKSRTQAERMMKKFRVKVPAHILNRLPEKETPDSIAIGTEIFMELTGRLKSLGAPGMHLYVIVDTVGASRSIERLVTELKNPDTHAGVAKLVDAQDLKS